MDWSTASYDARPAPPERRATTDVQADVAGLGHQRLERRDRRRLLGRDEVVVVDDDVHLGALPPRPGAELVGGHVGSGDAGLEVGRQVLDRSASPGSRT
jgi:hypothetical protein